MLNLIINKKEVDIPESWAEVTWKQGCEIADLFENKEIPENRFLIHLVSICTGFAPKFWERFTDLVQFQAIANGLSWAFRQDAMDQEIEKMKNAEWRKIFWDGREYTLPDDIGGCTAAQWIDASAVAQNFAHSDKEDLKLTTDDILSSKKHLFCIYFQGVVDEEYDGGKAMGMNIDGVSFVKVIRWADFFLINLLKSTNGTNRKPRKLATQTRNLLRDFRNSVKSGDGF